MIHLVLLRNFIERCQKLESGARLGFQVCHAMLKAAGGLATEYKSWVNNTPPEMGLVSPLTSKLAVLEIA